MVQRATRRRGWGMLGMAAVVGVAVAGGGAGYAWKSGLLHHVSLPSLGGVIPVITASTDPVKVVPPADTQASVDPGTRDIFQRPGQAPPRARARGDARGAARLHRGGRPPPAPVHAAAPTPAQTPAPASVLASVAAPAAQPSSAPPEPRRVKTVKVLSDGTVVTGETVAPPSTLPTGLPAAFADGGAPVRTVSAMADPVPAMPVPDMGPAVGPSLGATPDPSSADAAPPAGDAAPAAQPESPQTVSSLPAPALVPSTPDAVAPAPPVEEAAAPPGSASGSRQEGFGPGRPSPSPRRPGGLARLGRSDRVDAVLGGFVVQIASQKSETEANATFRKMQQRFGSVIGGMSANIRSADPRQPRHLLPRPRRAAGLARGRDGAVLQAQGGRRFLRGVAQLTPHGGAAPRHSSMNGRAPRPAVVVALDEDP